MILSFAQFDHNHLLQYDYSEEEAGEITTNNVFDKSFIL
jgi:hypothetical protein